MIPNLASEREVSGLTPSQEWAKLALEMATATSQHIRPQGVGACLRRRAASATPLQEALGAQKTFEN